MIQFWYDIVLYVDSFLNFWLETSALIVLSVFVGIFLLIIFFILLRFLEKKYLKNNQKLIYQYDNIFYVLSGYSYKTWSNEILVLMDKIFKSNKLNYISNHDTIFKLIKGLESDFWNTIIWNDIWSQILLLKRKIKTNNVLKWFIKIFSYLIIIVFLILFLYIKFYL